MHSFRLIQETDRQEYLSMCREFYYSPAVLHPVPEQHFQGTFDAMMQGSPFLSCYMMEQDGKMAGYALLIHDYSQEAGGVQLWLDELYIRPEFQGQGLGTAFFSFLSENLPETVKRLRLEYEPDNLRARALYQRWGFEPLEYQQMIKRI